MYTMPNINVIMLHVVYYSYYIGINIYYSIYKQRFCEALEISLL